MSILDGGPRRPTRIITAYHEDWGPGVGLGVPIVVPRIMEDDFIVSVQGRGRATGIVSEVTDVVGLFVEDKAEDIEDLRKRFKKDPRHLGNSRPTPEEAAAGAKGGACPECGSEPGCNIDCETCLAEDLS